MAKYCVYIIVYSGNLLPPFYIGSTSLSNIIEGYLGTPSSKEYKQLWKDEKRNNRNLFKLTIIKEFDTHKEALEFEEKIQRKLNVVQSSLYVNKSFAGRNFARNGLPSTMKGRKHTIETKQKISETKRLNKWTPTTETRRKMSESHKGKLSYTKGKKGLHKHTEEMKSKISKTHKGKITSEATKDLIRKKRIGKYKILTPDDKIIEVINLKQFCLDNKIDPGGLRQSNIGKIQRHKGYKLLERLHS